MPKVTYHSADGQSQTIDGSEGDSVMQTAIANGVSGILAECGGVLSCATCHVYVDQEWLGRLPPVADDEDAMLDCATSERTPQSRLSCQIKLNDELDGLVVRIPPSQ